jgi:hypothetical protein
VTLTAPGVRSWADEAFTGIDTRASLKL